MSYFFHHGLLIAALVPSSALEIGNTSRYIENSWISFQFGKERQAVFEYRQNFSAETFVYASKVLAQPFS